MKSAGGSTTFLSAVLVLVICCDVNSDLITKPTDADAVVGHTTFFNCSTTLTSAEIHWFHYAVGDTKDRSFVYGYDQFYSRYLGRFQMEKNVATGSYNLIITSVSIDDAGRYECQDDSGRGDKESAQLTVIDENPVCQSNIKPHGLIGPNIYGFEPDTLHLTCAVQFHGNQPPMMQWKEIGSDKAIAEGATRNASSDRAIYYVQMEVNSGMDGSSYQCVTTRSTQSQYVCTSDIVSVKSFSGTYIVIICILASLGLAIVSAIAGFKVGEHYMKKRGPTKNPSQQISPAPKGPEYIGLIGPQDNKAKKTAAKLAHTIVTKAANKTNETITGMTILDNNLFVVKKNYPRVEVYDSKTFVYVGLLDKLHFTNPHDIASSKETEFLFVIDRENSESKSKVFKSNTDGEERKMWVTESDDGRLLAYESNILVCFSTKRIIIEYTPEGQVVNTVRLSPGNGFNNLWHAVKLTGTHLLVSHSKATDGQRVCVVDINNSSFIAAFEEFPIWFQGLNLLSRDYLPICLVGQRDESVLVADARYKRVLLLSPKELEYEDVLIETGRNSFPVRLCVNETKDRLFVGVNSGEYSKPETWEEGCILIYNLSK